MNEDNILFYIKGLHSSIMKEMLKGESESHKVPRPTQMRIMNYMLEHKNEEVNQKDLEEHLKLSRATVSDVLKTMEKYKLIERITNPNDTRVKMVILNKKAVEIHDKNTKKMQDLGKVVVKGIPKEDIEKFKEVLQKMIKNIEDSTT